MSKAVSPSERRWTSIMVSTETRDLLKELKKRDFGAEETWDHLLRRLTGRSEGIAPEVPS